MQYCSCFCAQMNDFSLALGLYTCIGISMLTLRWSSTMPSNAPFEAACQWGRLTLLHHSIGCWAICTLCTCCTHFGLEFPFGVLEIRCCWLELPSGFHPFNFPSFWHLYVQPSKQHQLCLKKRNNAQLFGGNHVPNCGPSERGEEISSRRTQFLMFENSSNSPKFCSPEAWSLNPKP